MPGHSSDQTGAAAPYSSRQAASAPRRSVGPAELATWLQDRVPHLGEEWSAEILVRGLGQGTAVDRVVGKFVSQLVAFLPWLLGPQAEHVQPLWIRASELFGAMAAKRGLAAGEVIEEFQILRELVIRDLYREPPLGGRLPLSLREILRLNRILDSGVTHASVGHTDAMFFQFFEADNAPVAMSDVEVAREADAQLDLIREDMAAILEPTPSQALESTREH